MPTEKPLLDNMTVASRESQMGTELRERIRDYYARYYRDDLGIPHSLLWAQPCEFWIRKK